MLEAIKSIELEGKKYNWEVHVVFQIKVNFEICQEVKGSIRFMSLLIWIEMVYLCPISEVAFISLVIPVMK